MSSSPPTEAPSSSSTPAAAEPDASPPAVVLDGTTPGGADGSAPVLSAGGEVLSKSALKKLEKLKALEAKKAASAAAAEAKAAAAAAKAAEAPAEEGGAAKKVRVRAWSRWELPALAAPRRAQRPSPPEARGRRRYDTF
jgi:hypothetical protein